MIKPVKNPCYECNRRSPTCHGACEAYALFARYRQLIRDARKLAKDVDTAAVAGTIRRYEKR